MKNGLKIGLALVLLSCLLPMPYGYYILVRYLAAFTFGYLAYSANQTKKSNAVMVYLFLMLLFQPFFKLALGRTLWNVVDVVVALGLLFSVFRTPSKPTS
ncbi:hypothetical protein K5I29_05100 [Flavobacterium agricola]|uniref:SPW repeat-containing protein n=1 Tax=Flavobacterium agricola TaxID=2870839 RepID=A0ABY6M380_9FLAO|nr:DUF6804 family protein [Flavobacterium agricola]UYW02280.1 hypothetical protein K5I29_05100 [Flavobacterium agricola]